MQTLIWLYVIPSTSFYDNLDVIQVTAKPKIYLKIQKHLLKMHKTKFIKNQHQ